MDPRGPQPRNGVQGRSTQLSGKRERERAARRTACNGRVASWPSGLDGLSLPDHDAHTLPERPWTEKGT